MTVHAPVKDVTLKCPEFVTADKRFCNVTVTQGSNLTVHDTVNNKIRSTKVAGDVLFTE